MIRLNLEILNTDVYDESVCIIKSEKKIKHLMDENELFFELWLNYQT